MQGCRVNLQSLARRAKMDRPHVLQPHIFVVKNQMRQLGVQNETLRILQGAIDSQISGNLAMPAELFQVQRAQEEGIEIDVGYRSPAGKRERIREPQRKCSRKC